MKTFKCSLPIDLYLICQCDAQNVQHSQNQHFLVWISLLSQFIDISCLLICKKKNKKKTYIAFTCVHPLLSLFSFIIFILLLPFSMNFKSNFGLNLNTINLFHLNCKISFGFLPVKEKSLGLLELASKL